MSGGSTTADITLLPLLSSSQTQSASTDDETTVTTSTEQTSTRTTTAQPQGIGIPIWVPIVGGIVLIILLILLVLWVKRCRHRARYDYTALRDQISLPEKKEFAKRQQYDSMRESALLNCSFYLRSNGLYTLLDHLPEMGSRVKKHWFLVRDNKTKSEKLLTMMNKSPQILPFNSQTRQTVAELCLVLQHPYVYPIDDLDLVIEQDMIVVVQPLNGKGSLKDAIYHSRCTDKWGEKYSYRSTGLPVPKIQLFGRQILEALLFLEDKGFPPFQHLSSGNVILQNHVCRLTGLENVIFNQPSKLQPLIKKLLKKNSEAVDTICFGHLLFEMSTGFELDCPHPEPKHLISVTHSDVLQILNFIFENPTGSYPSIKQISEHRFFRDVVVREANIFNPQPIHMTPAMKTLLKSLRKGKLIRSKSKRDSLIAVEDETKKTSRQRSSSKSSVSKSKRSKSTKDSSKKLSVQDKNRKQSQEDTALIDVTTVPPTRNAFLQEIANGKMLKKTETNDRSAPKI